MNANMGNIFEMIGSHPQSVPPYFKRLVRFCTPARVYNKRITVHVFFT